MSLKVYNTATREKEEFVPVNDKKVGMYVCGVTVYDHSHIGHARSYVAFDVIRRYLEYKGYDVTYIQNFTDVDDKIIKKAKESERNALEISSEYIDSYMEDMHRLNVMDANHYPKASEFIPEMISVVEDLIEKGHAYESDGDVYFSLTSALDRFGTLTHQSPEDMMAGARVCVTDAKKDPRDFALWKKAKPGEIKWDSPWGEGRPGWHIECSTMSTHYLGPTLDIHGGGQDLMFPHHESEILQSECHTGENYCKYWLHNGFVQINQEKMSKSLGNFFTIKEILKKYHPMALRFFLVYTHYRSPIDFSDEHMDEAGKSYQRLKRTYLDLKEFEACGESVDLIDESKNALEDFEGGMNDDFNTRDALAATFDLVRKVNQSLNQNRISQDEKEHLLSVFDKMWSVYGFTFEEEKAEGLEEDLIKLMLEIREKARENKQWDTADAIRDGLLDLGILIEDSDQGPKWRMEE